MATRIRQLEDGLRSTYLHQSSEPHPLLSEDLLKIKAPLQRDTTHAKTISNTNKSTVEEEEKGADVVDASGTFSIGVSGETKYYGPIASSCVCTEAYTFFFFLHFYCFSTFLKWVFSGC